MCADALSGFDSLIDVGLDQDDDKFIATVARRIINTAD